MGHIANEDRTYQLLQQRLDRNITGAPYSPVFIQILQLLFSAEEAELARQIPLRPTLLSKMAAKLKLEESRLLEKTSRMAERGLVFDAEHNGQRYIMLAPVVIGFFEFIFMRSRQDLPLAELARLFEEYMMHDDRFAHSIFEGDTQLGRALVKEESLTNENYSEILDWEQATQIIKSASTTAVSLCACRHKASHLGKACANEQLTCLTLNSGAEALIKNGFATRINTTHALTILENCKEAGLIQIADNVRYGVGYMCNCCGCCCGMLQAMKTFNIRNAVVTSNWQMAVDHTNCTGCGRCLAACPIEAIRTVDQQSGNRHARQACVEENLCLGCGVCHSSCRFGAIYMKPRSKRVFTPETTFDKFAAMAMERGKLSNLIFDDPDKLSHRALGRIFQLVEQSAPVRSLLAKESIKSLFLQTLTGSTKRITGQTRK